MTAVRRRAAFAQRILVPLTAAAIATQFLLAGAAAFGAISFSPHIALGWVVLGLALIGLVLALASDDARGAAALLALLVALQVAFAEAARELPLVGALHGLNAVATMATAGRLAARSRSSTTDSPDSAAGASVETP
jgi:hypothetical protein